MASKDLVKKVAKVLQETRPPNDDTASIEATVAWVNVTDKMRILMKKESSSFDMIEWYETIYGSK